MGSRQGGDCLDSFNSNHVQDHEKDESSVGQKGCMRGTRMRGMRRSTWGAKKLLFWADSRTRAAEYSPWRGVLSGAWSTAVFAGSWFWHVFG